MKKKTAVGKTIRYLALLTERLPSYLFPMFLLFVEWFFRSAFKVDTQEFIGPALASAGAGMLITLTTFRDKANRQVPDNVPPELKEFVVANNLKLVPNGINKERVFVNLSWIFTFILTLLWMWSITISTQTPLLVIGPFPAHYYPGAASYIIGLAFSEVKEAI